MLPPKNGSNTMLGAGRSHQDGDGMAKWKFTIDGAPYMITARASPKTSKD